MRCGRLRLRQRGRVTQAACNQVRRRLPVAEDARNSYYCKRGTNRTWTCAAAAAGKRGKLGKCGRLIAHPMPSSHRVPSHLLSHAKEQVALSLISPACPYLYPSAILGHAPSPALPCLAPACLNFPYLAQLHRHNSHTSPRISVMEHRRR